jgi:hypothetical protein
MVELNNNHLLYGFAITVVLLFGGMMLSISGNDNFTGAAVGTTNVTIAGTAGITLNRASVNYSSGYYNDSCTQDYASIGVGQSGAETTDCWVNTSPKLATGQNVGHVLNNTGTTVINLTMDTDQTSAESYFCGSQGCPFTNVAKVEVRASLAAPFGEAGSCASGYFPPGQFTVLSSSAENSSIVLCHYLDYEDTNDQISTTYNFTIPKDADQGAKVLTTTYTATAIS